MADVLKVKLISPQDVLFFGEATSVSSKNVSGVFDVLPKHSDFITIVENQPITIRPASPSQGGTTKKEKLTFQFPLAVIYVHENDAVIYAKTEPPTL